MITPLLIGAAALLILGKRKQTIEGIGRVKRRVYVEIEAAQKAGVPLHEKYINLSSGDIDTLRELGERFGWKQTRRSVESGKAYPEAYFNSLRRAYNAITGVRGIGATHKVRNANGDVVLEWRDIEAAAAHVAQERDLAELEARLAKQRRSIRNARKGRNMVPAQSTYQDQQLYEQSNFPDQPQQLALFGVNGVGAQNFYWGKDKLYVLLFQDATTQIKVEVYHVKYDLQCAINDIIKELRNNGYDIEYMEKEHAYWLKKSQTERAYIQIDYVTAY